MTTEEKIKKLLESRKKTIERLRKVEERIKEKKTNEEVWPGHESVRYHQEEREYQVLLSHLAKIEKELRSLKRKSAK